jgi:aminopeptidase C
MAAGEVMSGGQWENTKSIEEKLELLRKDVIDIAAVQNALAREFRDLAHRLREAEQRLEALAKSRHSSEAT